MTRASLARKHAARVALWRARRDALMAELGNACAVCGSWEQLEFDHPQGRDYDVTKLARWQRMKQYAKDLAAGNLRLLCEEHNGRDGARRRWAKRRLA